MVDWGVSRALRATTVSVSRSIVVAEAILRSSCHCPKKAKTPATTRARARAASHRGRKATVQKERGLVIVSSE
jgi:hypothetical protein